MTVGDASSTCFSGSLSDRVCNISLLLVDFVVKDMDSILWTNYDANSIMISLIDCHVNFKRRMMRVYRVARQAIEGTYLLAGVSSQVFPRHSVGVGLPSAWSSTAGQADVP